MAGAYDFNYLIDKIRKTDFSESPFKHVYIEDFFSPEHFAEIKSSNEIASPVASNDNELIDGLMAKGFKPISFPGCVTDVNLYIDWHQNGKQSKHHSACEGFGMALRLYSFPSPIMAAVNSFLASEAFNRAIAEKFNVDFASCIIDGGIQKYLDGYEISPHPDIRKKAATFMVNINPSDASESLDHHTHYLRLKPSRRYVQTFWEGNVAIDRAWVPWEWAETVKQQPKNNSIVLFSPSNDTLHGVKANYDHLKTQRTQLYGNLWYKEDKTDESIEWEELDLLSDKVQRQQKTGLKGKALKLLPAPVKETLKAVLRKERGKRNI